MSDYFKKRVLSFKYAFVGIRAGFKEEPNIKFHLLIAVLVIWLSVIFSLTRYEWVAVLIMIGLVLTAELTNAALETVVDSFTNKEHPGAKLAKDVSAGAVLIVSIAAAVVGIIIFWPHLFNG